MVMSPGLVASEDRRGDARWFVPAAAAAACLIIVYAAWLTLHLGGDRVTRIVDDLGTSSTAVAATVLTAMRGLRSARGGRRGWLLLSAASAGFALGEMTYAFFELVAGRTTPFPSLADLGYLSGTVLLVAAVLAMGGSARRSSRVRLLLDGGIVTGAILLLSWLTALHVVYQAGGDSLFALALGLAYPVGDVVTVVIVLSTLTRVHRLDPALAMVGVAILLFAVSDSAFAYLTALGIYHGSNLLDAGFVAGYLLLGLASMLHDAPATAREDTPPARWQVALPYVPLVLAGVVLLVDAHGHTVDLFSEVVAIAIVGQVLLRQLMTVLESQSLATRLRAASLLREILIEQVPVGICQLDRAGRVLAANPTLQTTLGRSIEDLAGRPFASFVHAEDRGRHIEAYAGLGADLRVPLGGDTRFVRRDGGVIWCSETASVMRGAGGQVESFIVSLQDVTERRLQVEGAERAAHIQRQLLPAAPPEMDGYEVAGLCLPAQNVAGDFYDWFSTADGCLDITVADVMGKGVAAALVMAVLRTALRSAPPALGPADRVRLAARSMALGLTDEGLFVTLFHGRLNLMSGVLRYVDAGHGYCGIRRQNGRVVALPQRSLPMGVRDDGTFREGFSQLRPGDALIVYSDGLVEREDRTVTLDGLLSGLDTTESAADMVEGLRAGMPAHQEDDVTILVLHRTPDGRTEERSDPVATSSEMAVGTMIAGSDQPRPAQAEQ
jgi:PAS domain S-box-containing protein